MTTKARETEARAADAAFQIALAQIGAGTIEDALATWRHLDPERVAETADGWLTRAINLILGRRRMSRDLAMAYYRLARALRTGTTIADPFHPEPEYVTLGDLRREFAGMVADIEWVHQPEQQPALDQATADEERLSEDDDTNDLDEASDAEPSIEEREDDDERIRLEEIDALREAELLAEENAEKALLEELEQLGPVLVRQRLEELDPEATTIAEGRGVRDDVYATAGARVALASERATLNGGRGSVYTYGNKDPRAIGWARCSMSGDPCHFCAMLISRGAVYKSERSARFDGDGDKYHTDCHCVAYPIYFRSQYDTDEKFDQNRALEALWKDLKKANGGHLSANEWRRYIEQHQRAGDTPWVVNPTQTTTSATPEVA